MGSITRPLLDLMRIENAVLGSTFAEFERQLDLALARMGATGRPYALVVRTGTVQVAATPERTPRASAGPRRRHAITAIMARLPGEAVVVATTGKTGRELEAEADRDTNLYMVGSMGCAASIGLGLAMHRPERPVVVLDGDGAALMRLEAMATVGARRPHRFVHVILDNAAYESTGGQATNASTVDFAAIAAACGYTRVLNTADLDETAAFVHSAITGGGPQLVRLGISVGSDPGLGRPALGPADVARRLRTAINGSQS
jgi:phosphonopyruvate decarboxylase